MAKLTLLFAATFALFLLLANASIYRIEIEEDDVNQRQPRESCRREFQRHQQLRACQQFMRQQAGGGRSDADEDDEIFNQQSRQQCCNQLRQVEQDCVCDVLDQAIQQQRMQGRLQGQQVRQMYSTARNLPNRCNIPVRSCQFESSPY